mmetsp:Transcript_37961/g.108847  ORF Transcript_37961/g.108847 Transcript_37961/m.108847 type:complete len:298 (-) Transcript_37961:594-1487(-)
MSSCHRTASAHTRMCRCTQERSLAPSELVSFQVRTDRTDKLCPCGRIRQEQLLSELGIFPNLVDSRGHGVESGQHVPVPACPIHAPLREVDGRDMQRADVRVGPMLPQTLHQLPPGATQSSAIRTQLHDVVDHGRVLDFAHTMLHLDDDGLLALLVATRPFRGGPRQIYQAVNEAGEAEVGLLLLLLRTTGSGRRISAHSFRHRGGFGVEPAEGHRAGRREDGEQSLLRTLLRQRYVNPPLLPINFAPRASRVGFQGGIFVAGTELEVNLRLQCALQLLRLLRSQPTSLLSDFHQDS